MHHTTSDVLENFLMEACTHCTKIQHYLFNLSFEIEVITLHSVAIDLKDINTFILQWLENVFLLLKKKKLLIKT